METKSIISTAFLTHDHKIMFRNFHIDEASDAPLSALQEEGQELDDLRDHEIQVLFYETELSEELEENENLRNIFSAQAKHCALVPADFFKLSCEDYVNGQADEILKISSKIYQSWILKNNLNTLKSLPSICQQLKSEWKREPHQFIINLWYLLQSNLGSSELRLIFNDVVIEESKDENEEETKTNTKSKLIQSYALGSIKPQIFTGAELEEELMKSYALPIQSHFHTYEFDEEKNQVVLVGQICSSPLLLMAKSQKPSPLQLSLIEGLFDGLKD